MSETREYFQRKYPEFIDDIERRFNFTIGNLPVPTNELEWLDLVKLVYSGASAAKDASIRDYMNICEDLSRKLEEARGRIAELEQQLKHEKASHELLAEDFAEVYGEREKGFARIAELEAALRPFANEPLSTEPAHMKTRLWSFEDSDARIQAARDALEEDDGE